MMLDGIFGLLAMGALDNFEARETLGYGPPMSKRRWQATTKAGAKPKSRAKAKASRKQRLRTRNA